MAEIFGGITGSKVEVDTTPLAMRTALYDAAGANALKLKDSTVATTDRIIPIGGINDGVYRPIRAGRNGGLALERYTQICNLDLYTAALMPTWLNPVTTQTTTWATTTGGLLNASAIGTASTSASLISFQAIPKYQKTPIISRHRARLVKGSTNGQADWGLFGTQAPGTAAIANGFVFLFGSDGTLKPTYYYNGAVVAQGTDIAASINSTTYYVWDIILDDDTATFFVQDANTSTIISDQVLSINIGDARMGMQNFFFSGARTWVGGSANVGTATQFYVGDITALLLDTDTSKPWPHIQSSNGKGSVVNPTVALTQLANYVNSTAPASATLSNTTAGYTTLGGQFQFAAVAGVETDYALFGFTVPTGVKFICTGIAIDTLNTGAAVATTATWLQWFLGIDGTAVTLASNNFRVALGNQVFPIAAAIGAQATSIIQTFQTPYVTHSGRFFHVALKMPIGSATASQVIRGTVRVEGYFE